MKRFSLALTIGIWLLAAIPAFGVKPTPTPSPTPSLGPPTVVDSTGKLIGTYMPTVVGGNVNVDGVLLNIQGLPMILPFAAEGFTVYSVPNVFNFPGFLFTTSDCTGTQYTGPLAEGVNGSITGRVVLQWGIGGLFVDPANHLLYYASSQSFQTLNIASEDFLNNDGSLSSCETLSPPQSEPVTPMATYDLNNLALTPPFTVSVSGVP